MQRFRDQVKFLPRTFALVWSAARRWTVGWVALAVVEGLLPVATVYLTRSLVNGLIAAVRSAGGGREMRHILLLGGLMAAIMLASRLLRSAKSWVGEAQAELVRERISAMIHAKSAEADLQFYDSPEFYDHLHRAREEARYRPILLLENLGNLLQNGITFIAMIAILIPYGPILPVALLFSTLPSLYLVMRLSERRHQLGRETTTDERRTWYLDWLLTSGEAAQELRLFGLAGHFQDTYQAIRRNLREQRLRLAMRQTVSEIWTGILSLIVVVAALLYMLWKTIRGLLSLGDLALFYQAFNQGLSLSQGLLGSVGQLYENTLFLGNLFEFLDFESKIKDPVTPMPVPLELPQITFQNVSFRYPGTEKFALRDLNLAIPGGKTVAIVGPNGSGKSTILKLLCRFYDPASGAVELDGISLSEFSREQLRERISALFQVPVRYNATARENITYGNHAVMSNDVEASAREAAADSVIDGLPDRYETHLGRWFSEGAELSVGEWQRLALARALFRKAPILVLDEPTSAMDPWAELEWSKRFRTIAAGRTAIVITHRFTTAMFTDRIFVMRDGQVCEEGTHQELLDRNGVYASGWVLQQEESR